MPSFATVFIFSNLRVALHPGQLIGGDPVFLPPLGATSWKVPKGKEPWAGRLGTSVHEASAMET
jgi:hypothetical protein